MIYANCVHSGTHCLKASDHPVNLTLLSRTKDPLILAKLHVFSDTAGTIKPFLVEYQYTKPTMQFMYDLHQLLRDIVSKYIKPETLEKCKNTSIL